MTSPCFNPTAQIRKSEKELQPFIHEFTLLNMSLIMLSIFQFTPCLYNLNHKPLKYMLSKAFFISTKAQNNRPLSFKTFWIIALKQNRASTIERSLRTENRLKHYFNHPSVYLFMQYTCQNIWKKVLTRVIRL